MKVEVVSNWIYRVLCIIMVNDYQENYGYGWISLYRSIKKHWIFENEKYLKWWIIMLFEVNHSSKKITRYYEIYEIQKGQSCNSLRTWANLFNCSTKTVTKFFKLLEKDKMISIKNIGKGKHKLTLINIDNYNDYQGERKHTLLQGGNTEETQRKQSRDTNNNYNKENNGNNDVVEYTPPSENDILKPYNSFINNLKKGEYQISVELWVRKLNGDKEKLNRLITQDFKRQILADNKKHNNAESVKSHFNNFMRYQ